VREVFVGGNMDEDIGDALSDSGAKDALLLGCGIDADVGGTDDC
jgi:hypothetical protein